MQVLHANDANYALDTGRIHPYGHRMTYPEIPSPPLTATDVEDLIDELRTADQTRAAVVVDLLTHRVAPGVDDAARAKAAFLAAGRGRHRDL